VSPYCLTEHINGDDPAPVPVKSREEGKFFGGQRQSLPSLDHLGSLKVNAAACQAYQRLFPFIPSSEDHPDTEDQLSWEEWLHNIVNCPQAQAQEFIFLLSSCRKKKHRDI